MPAPAEPSRDDSPPYHAATGQPIEPVAFTPLGGRERRPPRRGPAARILALSAALLATAGVLGFLLGAQGVILTLVPEDARLSLRGGAAVHWGERWLAWPGDYQLTASAPGYRALSQPLAVTREPGQKHRFALEKLPGHLALTTVPAGAAVTLDGDERGITPLTLGDLSAGTHHLALRHPRYKPLQQDIDIEGLDRTQELALTLEPAWGTVRIDSKPAGARVLVAGVAVATAPASVEVVAGKELRLELPGHKPWRQRIEIAPGEARDLGTQALAPADATLEVISTPPGASVTLDGHHQGSTPLTLEVAPGRARRIALFLPGYADANREVRLKSAEHQSLEVALQPRLGTLNITLEPADTRLYIDDVHRPGAAHNLELPARPHRLRAERDGYETQERTLTPVPGTPQAIVFKLRTPAQERGAALPATIETPAGQQLRLFRPEITFTMGSGRREQGRRSDEVERRVTLRRPFYLGLDEVTNAQYRQFDRTHSSGHAGGKTLDLARQPVVRVSWSDAARYCNWLSGKAGLKPFYIVQGGRITGIDKTATGFRLPTEAEWAWAARIGADGRPRRFAWGDEFPPAAATANLADTSAGELVATPVPGYADGHAASAPVGSFPAGDKGLYDLGGNVAEWVHDFHGVALPGAATEQDPLGPERGANRVIRGPSWRHGNLVELRLAHRDQGERPRDDVGFRLARYAE